MRSGIAMSSTKQGSVMKRNQTRDTFDPQRLSGALANRHCRAVFPWYDDDRNRLCNNSTIVA
jgi:hypothetical protein